MDYNVLKDAIKAYVKDRTGIDTIDGDGLQETLLAIVNSLGAGYMFAGVAKLTPTQTDPGTPDQNVFYIAAEPGTYTNFPISGGYLQVAENEVAIFKYNGQWSKETTGAATAAQVTELGQYFERFELVGVGNWNVSYRLKLNKGCSYRLYINPNSWSISSVVSSAAIFAIDKYYNGSSSNVVVVRANNPSVSPYYDIVAADNEYYTITIRGDVGQSVCFDLINTTYIETIIDTIGVFSIKGTGNNNVIKTVHLYPNCTYRIYLEPIYWAITSVPSSAAIFAIDKYYDGVSTNVLAIRANGQYEMQPYFDFKTDENEYYKFVFRADVGAVINFMLENITDSKSNVVDLDTTGWALNDGYVYTSFSAPHLNIEPTKGIGYVTGLASKTQYTESGGDLILAVFPCIQPYRLEYFSVAKTGDTDIDGNPLSGTPYDMCSMGYYDSNNIFIIRSFFVDFNGYNLYYRDFNTDTKSFVSAPVKVQYYDSNNNLADVTDAAMTAWVTAQGGSWNGPQKTIFTNHIINDKTLWNDGNYIYSVLTAAGPGNPIVVKSDDNFATIHLVAMLPNANATAETAIAKLNGTVYIIYRTNQSILQFQTTTDFVTFSTLTNIPGSQTQRPEIMVYNNNVYLFVPMRFNRDSIMGGRSSYRLLKGTGSDLSKYKTELILNNNFGMVYASAQFFNGRLLLAYSTNELMLGGDVGGKSTMMFNIIKNYYQG